MQTFSEFKTEEGNTSCFADYNMSATSDETKIIIISLLPF